MGNSRDRQKHDQESDVESVDSDEFDQVNFGLKIEFFRIIWIFCSFQVIERFEVGAANDDFEIDFSRYVLRCLCYLGQSFISYASILITEFVG